MKSSAAETDVSEETAAGCIAQLALTVKGREVVGQTAGAVPGLVGLLSTEAAANPDPNPNPNPDWLAAFLGAQAGGAAGARQPVPF